MTRVERRWHLVIWIALTPVVLALLVAALASRPARLGAADVAPPVQGAPAPESRRP